VAQASCRRLLWLPSTLRRKIGLPPGVARAFHLVPAQDFAARVHAAALEAILNTQLQGLLWTAHHVQQRERRIT
jgi:hypothetical protein